MGKKVKKKGRSPHKEKRVTTPSPKIVPKQSSSSVETVDDKLSVMKEKKSCAHLDRGFDLAKLSEKIGSTDPVRCKECREGNADRKGSKAKGKHGKKKGSNTMETKSVLKAIWFCLDCGHYACGGVGFPTTPQSHAVRHAKLTRHPLAIQFDNPNLCWCFPCNSLIPVQKSEEDGEQKDNLLNLVKLIKGRSVEKAAVDVEDVWFGGGSIKNEVISESSTSGGSGIDGRDGYMVRGLVNLGNTCFFNSVMQNLLAMDRFRDFFLKLERSVGPLTAALKKLFTETSPEIRSKNVINPRAFFGCLCSKAPQFRGYQQHDSHELLRCLVDGLSAEELSERKRNSSEENRLSPGYVPTFVDAIFGGRISSTVCCKECGHSSTVYEPFLDLSLPVPAKKPPPKKAQPVSRAKKTKLLPKRAGRMRSKANKDADILPVQSVAKPSDNSESTDQVKSSAPAWEGDSTWLDFISPCIVAGDSQSLLVAQEVENNQVSEYVSDGPSVQLTDSTWLDYIEPGEFPDDCEVVSQENYASGNQNLRNEDTVQDGISMQNSSLSSGQICSSSVEPNLIPNSSSWNTWEDDVLLPVQGSEVLLLPYKEVSSTTGNIEEGDALQVAAQGQDSLDFDGFGDLFNEPETSSGSVTKPSTGDYQENEVAETGLLAGNSSESADEVDDSDSPVSIESCLFYFTKPELLSGEHGWHCENCSKNLQRQKKKLKRNHENNAFKTEVNGDGFRNQSDSLNSEKDLSCSTQVRNFNDGNIKSVLNTSSESCSLYNGKLDDSDKKCSEPVINQTGKLNSTDSQWKEGRAESMNDFSELSSSCRCKSCSQSSSTGQTCDSFSVNKPSSNKYNTAEVQHGDSQLSANECESEESGDEEQDSGNVKVKRDATKKFLIDKAPPILTIHLKRFSQDARGRLSKLNGHVDFRDTIDLRPYMDPRCKESDKYIYRLLGVVEHLGTMRGGHYVAYVKGGVKSRVKDEKEDGAFVWYHASDTYVHEVSLEEVLRCEAYILFYEKV